MKREEAKRIAMGLRTDFKCESDTMVDFCNTIIKALEQEPCEDCISRQTVLEYIEGSEAELGHSSENELVCRDIKEFPSVTPQLKSEVFDKIRAEIKALSPEPTAYDVVDGNPTKDAVWETLADVLKIIDKYKAESEGKDEIYHKTDSM